MPGMPVPTPIELAATLSDRCEAMRFAGLTVYNPLRYAGETYYQSSFDRDNQGTILQVVRNPSWLTPYFSCVLVSIGMIYQFFSHLTGFASKRKTA